jgi:hypothetical protein
MFALLSRLWGIVIGIMMIALSLLAQLLIFMVIGTILTAAFLRSLDPWIAIFGLLVLFNGVACYEYFRRRRVATLGGSVHKLAGLVRRDSGHYAMVIFLVLRGIDRIITGRELKG